MARVRIRILRRWTNDFTGLSFVTYTDQHGCTADVCTVENFLNPRVKKPAERRAEAFRKVAGIHAERPGRRLW